MSVTDASDADPDRTAKILFAYFHPWALDPEVADDLSPLPTALPGEGQTWMEALQAWLEAGALHREAQRHLASFLNVTATQPGEATTAEAAEEDADLEELTLEDAWPDQPP